MTDEREITAEELKRTVEIILRNASDHEEDDPSLSAAERSVAREIARALHTLRKREERIRELEAIEWASKEDYDVEWREGKPFLEIKGHIVPLQEAKELLS